MTSFLNRAAMFAAFLVISARAEAQRADTVALSLGDAVAMAVRSSDEVQAAAAQIDMAEAQVAVSRAGILPQLRLSGGYTRTIESARGQAVGQIFNQANTYTVTGNLSQTVFEGGRVLAGWRAATRTRQAARLNAAEARAQITLDVERAYLQALFSDQMLGIQETNYELAEARLEQVQQLEQAGRVAHYDVLRARVERANLEPLVVQAQSDRDIALLNLKRLLNIPLDQPLRLTTAIDAPSVEAVLAAADADSAADGSLRASVRSAELVARARRDVVTATRGDLWPTISVFLNYGAQAFPRDGFPWSGGRLGNNFCPPGANPTQSCHNGGWFSDMNVGLNFSWPLFDGFRTKGNLELGRAQARQAEIDLARERKNVALEVARSRAELTRARTLYSARRQTAAEAEETFRLASLRYSRGLGTQLDVSDAQLALLTAQTNEARAIYDLYLAAAALARAQGREIPLPAPAATPTRPPTTPDSGATPDPRSQDPSR
jgi:outer membrane protein TolC